MTNGKPDALFTADKSQDSLLTNEEMAQFTQELWRLLSRRAGLYAVDSSSLRAETAEDLLSSICYLLHLYQQKHNLPLRALAQASDLDAVLDDALQIGKSTVQKTNLLYQQLCANLPKLKSDSMLDTLHSIGAGFRKYDLFFFAHRFPCTIDYQLCLPVNEQLCGISYITDYLTRLFTENRFLKRFPPDIADHILTAACPDYPTSVESLFEPVFINALGLSMLQQDEYRLNITAEEQDMLAAMLKGQTESSTAFLLRHTAENWAKKLKFGNGSTKYLALAAEEVAPRIHAAVENGSLAHVFLAI